MKQMNSTQKRQFKRKVLNVIGCIFEDPDSLSQYSCSSVASYSTLSVIQESRTDNSVNQYKQYDPAESGFGILNL